jgi:cellulose synthase operon protein C
MLQRWRFLVVGIGLFLGVGSVLRAQEAPASEQSLTPLATATEHRLRGRYEEAAEAYEGLLKSTELAEADRIAVWLGQSRVHEESGRWEDAEETITAALTAQPKSPALLARHAELCFLRGRYALARELAQAGVDQDSQHVHSRLILAHALAELGQLDEAAKAYHWFVQYYNRTQPKDAETLLWIGEGAAQYARWNRVSSIFRFVVNDVCTDALQDNKNAWQAALLSGSLLLEKYNESQAVPEFHNALRINPHVAEIHAAIGLSFLQDYKHDQARERAEQALKCNPRSPTALVLMADTYLLTDVPEPSAEWLDKALAINPADQRVLGRKAALALLGERLLPTETLAAAWADLPQMPKDSKLPKPFLDSLATVLQTNPKPGEMLSIIGNVLESHRKFEQAEVCYRKAVEIMPQLTAPRTQLGMLCMRTGKVDEAEKLLNEAFEADPFHVRTSNMRKVIGVLKTYDTITTEHFVIRIDHDQRLLGQAMADHLELAYPELTQKFGFEPQQRTQFEIYCNAKGQGAHAWFSSRMIGLPWIQTIGASTGVMVAMANPNQTQKPYHWGRVLRHEFSHVLTLQATQFNIPHWYTEALAVRIEGSAFNPSWEELLLERQPKGELFNLDTINDGFRKPNGPDDWTLAYCQATLYAKFLEQKYGPDSNAKLLTAYRQGKTTEEALKELFSIEKPQFETEYREFLAQLVATFTAGRAPVLPDQKTAEANYKANMDDMQAADEYAFALMRTRRVPQARKIADAVLAQEPERPLSNVIVALMNAKAGKQAEAIETLTILRDVGDPHREVLAALCTLAAQQKNWKVVLETAQIGRQSFPRDALFASAAAKACEELGDTQDLAEILEVIVLLDQDDPAARRKLAKIKLTEGDAATARKWAADSLLIDVTSVETQELLGRSCAALEDWKAGERAFATALELEPGRVDSQLGLAECYARTDQKDKARELLDAVDKSHPDHAGAKKLREKLKIGVG